MELLLSVAMEGRRSVAAQRTACVRQASSRLSSRAALAHLSAPPATLAALGLGQLRTVACKRGRRRLVTTSFRRVATSFDRCQDGSTRSACLQSPIAGANLPITGARPRQVDFQMGDSVVDRGRAAARVARTSLAGC